MEDAHIAEVNLTDDTSLFGVFDGHGGLGLFIVYISSLLRQGSCSLCGKTFC